MVKQIKGVFIKTVIIGFSKDRRKFAIFSRLIQWVQSTPFSHVYTKVFWPSANEDIVYQASGTQVNAKAYSYFIQGEEVVAEFTFVVQEETWQRIAKFMVANINKPYSIKEVAGLALRILGFKLGLDVPNPFHDGPASFVCSELGADIYKLINPEFALNPEQIGPKELYDALEAKK